MADNQLKGINEFLFIGTLNNRPKIFDMKKGQFAVFTLTQDRVLGKNNKTVKTYMEFVSFREQVVEDLMNILNKAKIKVVGILTKAPDKRFPGSMFIKLVVDSIELVENLQENFDVFTPKPNRDKVEDVELYADKPTTSGFQNTSDKPLDIEGDSRKYEKSMGKSYTPEEIAKDPNHPKYEMMTRAFESIRKSKQKPTTETKVDNLVVNDDDLPF
jgi:single-stranded DNA-binding protein